MSRYDTEEEQVEAIKAWWKRNGLQLLSLLLVGVIIVSGWYYWNHTKRVDASNASVVFEVLRSHMQQKSFGEVSREALKLIQEQPESPYAAGAAMLYATYSFEKGEAKAAIQHLNWVINNGEDSQLKHTALLNIARIYADQKNFTAADASLSKLAETKLTMTEKATFDYISGLVALTQSKEGMALVSFTHVINNEAAEVNLIGLAQIQLDDLSK